MVARRLMALTAFAVLVAPASAYAATGEVGLPPWPAAVIGILGLVAAVFALMAAWSLRKVAEGSAVAENVTYVVLGVICLAASVLGGWIPRIVDVGLDAGDVRVASDGLVVVSMAFFAIYFFRVSAALVRFLRTMSAENALAAAQIAQTPEDLEDLEDGDRVG